MSVSDKPACSSCRRTSRALIIGHASAAGAAGELVVLIATSEHVLNTFQRRCRAAQQYRAGVDLRPLHGNIPGRVAKAVLLFIGAVVLLIHDDQPRRGKGGKNGRAGTDNDMCRASAGGLPGAVALGIAQSGVQDCDIRRKALLEARQGLRCQADFRDQHQRLAPPLQAVGNQLQVDFGFATAGNALQQVATEALPGRLSTLPRQSPVQY